MGLPGLWGSGAPPINIPQHGGVVGVYVYVAAVIGTGAVTRPGKVESSVGSADAETKCGAGKSGSSNVDGSIDSVGYFFRREISLEHRCRNIRCPSVIDGSQCARRIRFT